MRYGTVWFYAIFILLICTYDPPMDFLNFCATLRSARTLGQEIFFGTDQSVQNHDEVIMKCIFLMVVKCKYL